MTLRELLNAKKGKTKRDLFIKESDLDTFEQECKKIEEYNCFIYLELMDKVNISIINENPFAVNVDFLNKNKIPFAYVTEFPEKNIYYNNSIFSDEEFSREYVEQNLYSYEPKLKTFIIENPLNRWFENAKRLTSQIKNITFDEAKNMFTFRMNEERKNVTLYNNGVKIAFVKCQEGDDYDWKIGLGVCYYKAFLSKDKEINYIKNNMNWKEFYILCFNKLINFDENIEKRLEIRVERDKHKMKPIKIND